MVAAAVIGAVGAVAAGLLAAKNQKQPNAAASVAGGAQQMAPQMGSLTALGPQPSAPAPNPAFGQFLGGQ